jgi:hypothetical protein
MLFHFHGNEAFRTEWRYVQKKIKDRAAKTYRETVREGESERE